jgi:aspartyl/asparaginyl beta-hydroxylase (cupin superfamily)
MNRDLEAVARSGVAALQRGDAVAARDAFMEIQTAGRATHQLRLFLAQACAGANDSVGAHAALDRVLADEPTNLYALILRGDLHAAAGDERAAVSWYQAALDQAPRAGKLPPDLLERLRGAEVAAKRAAANFQTKLEEALATAGVGGEAIGPRFGEALEILSGKAQVQLQQPTSFYYPRLPQQPFFDTDDLEWVAVLEAAAPAMRAELEAILADDGAEIAPYVVADPNRPAKRHTLMGDPKWSALHLYRGGEIVPANADRCSATMAALAHAPIPHIAGRSPMALFSVLAADTHIPPHHGMLNTRLICHIPLIVPDGCRLRVGNETRAVMQDRAMLFDDTIEHEAWNDGSSTRVVLLFEVWRPELTVDERAALTTLFETISLYQPASEDQAGA